jgi:hypothetical protein
MSRYDTLRLTALGARLDRAMLRQIAMHAAAERRSHIEYMRQIAFEREFGIGNNAQRAAEATTHDV